MADIAIFEDEAFTVTSLTAALNDQPYLPGRISSLGLFREEGITTLTVQIEKDGMTLALVKAAARGGPGQAVIGDKRNDENVLVSQMHGAFASFHNALAQDRPKASFEELRQMVTWHYQWMLLTDFLPRLCGQQAMHRLLPALADGRGPDCGRSRRTITADLRRAADEDETARRLQAMDEGATLIAPETVFFSHDTVLGRDVTIEPNVFFGPGVTVADKVLKVRYIAMANNEPGTLSYSLPMRRWILNNDMRRVIDYSQLQVFRYCSHQRPSLLTLAPPLIEVPAA